MTGLQARITVLRHACWWQFRASVTTMALSLSPRSVAYSLNQMSESQFARFTARAALPGDASLCQVVNAVQAIPYGRPRSRTADGVISEWKGTCSTKHALLAQLLAERWPQVCPRLVHRVYHVSRESALQRHGADAASTVPEGGLTDMHR